MRMFSVRMLAAVLAMAISSPAWSSGDSSLSFEDIRIQQEQIRGDLLRGHDAYNGLSKRERDELVQRQDGLLALIEGKETLLDLDEDGRTDAINSLEWIRAKLDDAEMERLICNREKRVGSNRVVRVCHTVAERRRARDDANRAWQKGSPCSVGRVSSGGGG